MSTHLIVLRCNRFEVKTFAVKEGRDPIDGQSPQEGGRAMVRRLKEGREFWSDTCVKIA
jgi:hypothetical protein